MGSQNKSNEPVKKNAETEAAVAAFSDFDMTCKPPKVEQGARVRVEISATDTSSTPFVGAYIWRAKIAGMTDQRNGSGCMEAKFKNGCTLFVDLACDLAAALGPQKVKIYAFPDTTEKPVCSDDLLKYKSSNKPMTIT